ncbi:DUF2000 domain-containing protein [Amycolatopsis sp. NPDC051903]|uniref:DUF2000 domain-containing protein n=1 Tax=Amycolatopsis sp. NPDC051903 TaxID=3363936 RepID=UPI00379E9277
MGIVTVKPQSCVPVRTTSAERAVMPEQVKNKCAIVVSEELPAGLAANAAAVLSITLGHRVDGLVGADVKDADGVAHPGIVGLPIPILNAAREKIATIVQAAVEEGELFFVSFTSLAQSCRTYDEYTEKMSVTSTAGLDTIGVGLHGPPKRVNRLVGALPLLR